MIIEKKFLLGLLTLFVLSALTFAKPATASPFATSSIGANNGGNPGVVSWHHHHRHHHHHDSGISIRL